MENNNLLPTSNNSDQIDLKEMVMMYLRKWYWFVISAALFVTLAYFYLEFSSVKFQVQTSILLRKDSKGGGLLDMSMLDGLGVGGGGSSKEVEDEIQVLTSKTIMQNVIRTLGIETECFEKKKFRFEEMYPVSALKLVVPTSFNDTTKNPVEFIIKSTDQGFEILFRSGLFKEKYVVSSLNQAFKTPIGLFRIIPITSLHSTSTYKLISYPRRNLTMQYSESVKVASANKKSNVINITSISACPKKTEVVINKLVELYNLDAVLDKNMIAQHTSEFVEERLKLISNELLEVELDVEHYKKQNKLTDISSEAEIFLKSSSEYDKKLAEIETQLNLVGFIESSVKDNKNQYNLVPANLGIKDESLLALMQEYNKALLERMKIMRTTNSKNPVITQMEQQLKELRSSIIVSIGSIKDGLKISKKDILGKDAQFASKIRDVPTQERKYIEIKRQQEIKQKLYLFLLQKREENALSQASTIPSAKTLDAAYTSLTPLTSRTTVFLFAMMLGCLLPIVIIYLLSILNDKITNRKDFTKLVANPPFLGSIIQSKSENNIVVEEGKSTIIVEMFRSIRTNLQFLLTGKTSPVILITSSISGEGKSFVSINIAMSLALMKKKVVLVGLDIRNPMLGEYMHISKANGVTLFLSDPDHSLEDIIIPSGFHPYLKVIPAGPIPPNPAELLMSTRLDEMIAELKKDFDYIILDSAPVGLVSDTFLLNRLVDSTIYVARQDYTPREMSELINEVYDKKTLNNMSVILNGTDENSGYGYGYGSKKYHQDEVVVKKSALSKLLRR